MFQPDDLSRCIEQGEVDAEAHLQDIERLVAPELRESDGLQGTGAA